MQVELGMFERYGLLGLIPQKGDINTARLLFSLRKKLGPSDEEIEAHFELDPLRGPDGSKRAMLKRDEDGALIDFKAQKQFTVSELVIIRQGLEELNQKKELQPGHIGLWEIFVEEKTEGVNAEASS